MEALDLKPFACSERAGNQGKTQREGPMRNKAGLVKTRNELKQEITLGMYTLLMGLIFEYTSRLIQKVRYRKSPPPFHYTVLIIAFLIQLIQVPGLIVALLLNETHHYSELSLLGSLSIELAFAGVLVAKININYVLQNLRDHVVDAIESVEDLCDLRSCLSNFWAIRKQLSFATVFGVIAGALTAVGVSQATKEFVGVGFTISAILAWIIALIPVYYLFQMAILPFRLSRYQYNLYQANPIRSDVLRHLSLTLKNYTYVVAGFIAFATFFWSVSSSTRVLNTIVLLVGWIPLWVQFVSNRSAVRSIARNAKWKTLKEVELKVRKIQQQADLGDKETIESITRLMDYHDRISATHDAPLEVRARLSFLNQIMLTLLAAALANINLNDLLNSFQGLLSRIIF